MASEIEVKFKVESFMRVREALKAAGAEYLGTANQNDVYFERADKSLGKGDCGLRVRTSVCIEHGTRGKTPERFSPLLTLKGPRQPHGWLKVRREIQTHFDNADAMVEILRSLGLAGVTTVQKRRASYKLGNCRIELDELPLIGRFVEIEAPGEVSVRTVCEKLKLTGKPISTPYTDLLATHRRRVGLPPTGQSK